MSMIGMFVRLDNQNFSKVLSDPSLLEEIVDHSEEKNMLDIDKSWEGIYYVLTGSALAEETNHPMGRVMFSGQFFDENLDMGYGPAHYLNPEQVIEISRDLEAIDDEELKKRYDGAQMDEKGVYPEGWKDEGSFEYLQENFRKLKDFFRSSAELKCAVVSYIS